MFALETTIQIFATNLLHNYIHQEESCTFLYIFLSLQL